MDGWKMVWSCGAVVLGVVLVEPLWGVGWGYGRLCGPLIWGREPLWVAGNFQKRECCGDVGLGLWSLGGGVGVGWRGHLWCGGGCW